MFNYITVLFKVMQVPSNEGFLVKTNVAVSSAIRNTSCSRGWLRVVVQTLFGLITVASFIMIMVMALQRNPADDDTPAETRRCLAILSSCRVVCSNAPFYEEFVYEIVEALMDIEYECPDGLTLTLNRPTFTNSTTPIHWLSEIRSKVVEFTIVGGNLRCIQPDSFMSEFAKNIRTFVLEDITLVNFGPNSLVGLSNLIEFDLRDCQIRSVERNALRAVDDTLQALYIRSSGYWNPANLTGSSELKELATVDFSSNEFASVLGRESFRQLEECKVLRLSSSRIISIGMGTFDFMVKIQRIYLNNNFLVSLPAGIFDRVTALAIDPKPAIDLQDNLWRCDCYIEHLRRLQDYDFLMVDPACDTPFDLNGRTFSSFETFCCENHMCTRNGETNSSSRTEVVNSDHRIVHIRDSLYIDGSCRRRKSSKSLLANYKCITNRARYLEPDELLNISKSAKSQSSDIEPSFYMESSISSLLELTTSSYSGYNLLWYQTICLSEIYCVRSLPSYLRLYNINRNSTYIFCVIEPTTGVLAAENCIAYLPPVNETYPVSIKTIYARVVIYVATVTMSIVLGASCLYTIIRHNPTLLRGSKRILLVKHKAVDALVLPPRVPKRNEVSRENSASTLASSAIELNWKANSSNNIIRTNSVMSGKSNAPSYVSAIQPTEAQLAEWRLKHHFNNNDVSVSSVQPMSLESGLVSYIYDGDSFYYSDDTTVSKTEIDDVI